ncbi:hypothetical protein Pmani_028285 [Petrolisthes manimaculis]|uniref:L-dopachrome isomerase n=1 Tax=Petrolisthes manimaculis TaxID=1843537 RepID=A0AAE1P2F5_9EUCA|nr:hypothetical protein Pmani_028285 [Petrolisthes manimaculis]
MPVFQLFTNVPKEKITPQILTELTKVLSTVLGKPQDYCMVHIAPDQLMSFGGSTAPCGAARLTSVGKLGVQENKNHAKQFYEYLEKHLGIPGDRMYIEFTDKESSEIGYKGTTFHEILGH